MKFLYLILVSFISFSCSTPKMYQKTSLYLDQDNKPISEKEYYERNGATSKWLFISEDGQKGEKIAGPDYETFYTSYPAFLNKIETITGKKFDKNTILLINYSYKDDPCGPETLNRWTRRELRERKNFLKPKKKFVEESYENLIFLKFFEEGIYFPDKDSPEKKYFFTDKGNFLRNTIFQHPSYCGSFAIIKPDGNILVRNGESTPDYMAKHIEKWDTIFIKSEN